MKIVEMTGEKFGKLLVIRMNNKNRQGKAKLAFWLCRCDCGVFKTVSGSNLRSGSTRSCGCVGLEKIRKLTLKHGKTHTCTFHSWDGIKQRCLNPKNKDYPSYGGRGIKVCKRWQKSFNNFLKDMGERTHGLSIERIDNNKGYFPTNCKWATVAEQNRNMRKHKPIKAFGESKTVFEWVKDPRAKTGRINIHNRIKILGWDAEKAISTPVNKAASPRMASS